MSKEAGAAAAERLTAATVRFAARAERAAIMSYGGMGCVPITQSNGEANNKDVVRG